MSGRTVFRLSGMGAVLFFFVTCLAFKYKPGLGFIKLDRFGAQFESRRFAEVAPYSSQVILKSGAYDGQFYAQMAVSPLLRNNRLEKALDAPVYRAQRVLLPSIAWILGGGNPGWIVCYTYPLLNVAAWFLFAYVMSQVFRPWEGSGIISWVLAVLAMGVLESVRSALTDLPAMLWIIGFVSSFQQGRPRLAALCLLAASLTKETSLLCSTALLSVVFSGNSTLRRFLLVFCIMLPALLGVALWSVYVRTRFQGHLPVGGNFTPPFVGLVSAAKTSFDHLLRHDYDSRHWGRLLFMGGLVLQVGWLLFHNQKENPWWWIGVSHGLLACFLGPYVWDGYWAAARALLPLTISFLWLYRPSTPREWMVLLLGNLCVLDACSRFI